MIRSSWLLVEVREDPQTGRPRLELPAAGLIDGVLLFEGWYSRPFAAAQLHAIERSGVGNTRAAAGPAANGLLHDVPGLGPGRREALLQAFGTVEALRAATVEDLSRVPGVGRTTALRVLESLR